MLMRFHLILLCLWMNKGFMSCMDSQIPSELHIVALGDSLTLNCAYNCSTGFVRGCWKKEPVSSACLGERRNDNGEFCTVHFHVSNVSAEDLKYNYYCYTEATDHPKLNQKTERVVHLKAQTTLKPWTVTPNTKEGEFTEIQVLATFSLAVAVALIALVVYICVNHKRCSGNGDDAASRSGSPLHSRVVGSPVNESSQNERLTVRGPNSDADNESQTEFPYADIMITIRGVSTPELTQVSYLTTEEPQQWRGCKPRCQWQASRSADRLHLPQPKEVSRKMSTNSEYAVITYA
ncbi:uncharacterized protein LOC129191577 isoform X2 [Dunckerocampus dactyliophorus]|uniref:uncharacterized protein LOC129191577 isoform X2 n=1 Tax=Dunckerocampus dactyliophorus TaxID=161453 RepID=UPI0024053A44|nr:uncharacterized protein LOC129191577 isoform X2 [Dunckerocampus dactyliophorus]